MATPSGSIMESRPPLPVDSEEFLHPRVCARHSITVSNTIHILCAIPTPPFLNRYSRRSSILYHCLPILYRASALSKGNVCSFLRVFLTANCFAALLSRDLCHLPKICTFWRSRPPTGAVSDVCRQRSRSTQTCAPESVHQSRSLMVNSWQKH